jgi:hypothetical protein
MQRALLLIAFGLLPYVGGAADQPPDLTGTNAKTLDAHLGRVVSLRGKLGVGMHGDFLAGATPKDVVFYIIADRPPSGHYRRPESWDQLRGRQVRVTGTLKFRKFPRPPDGKYEGGWSQPPPDYYYMVLQQTQIQPVETK